jgi:Secretion system C-terminal sorting domain
MKKNQIIFFVIIFHLGFSLQAQICGDVPDDTNVPGTNIFQWFSPTWKMYIQNGTNAPNEYNAASPFNTIVVPGTNLENVLDLYTLSKSEYAPSEGWVLVKKSFGIPTDGIVFPYIILYNKYQALLRIVFYIPPGSETYTSFNSSSVALMFGRLGTEKKISGLLSFATLPTNALDGIDNKSSMTTPNLFSTGGKYWLKADFPMAYDPCTCYFESSLVIVPNLIDKQDIVLSFVNGSSASGIVNSGVVNQTNYNSFLSIINGNPLADGLSAGNKYFKQGSDLITSVKNVYDAFNTQYSVPVVNPTTGVASIPTKITSDFPPWLLNLVPEIGFVAGVLDFLIAGGTSSNANPPATGIEALLKYKLNGTLTNVVPWIGSLIRNPGSKGNVSSNDGANTVYNNSMGIFALTETPTLSYWRSGVIPYYNLRKVKFRLNGAPIKYALNPSSGLVLTDLKAALVLTTTKDTQGASFGQNFIKATKEYNRINHPGAQFWPGYPLPVEENLDINQAYIAKDKSSTKYETPFMSLGCLGDYTVGGLEDFYSNPINVTLKVKAIFKRIDNPTAKEVVVLTSYNLNTVKVGEEIPFTEASNIYNSILVEDINLTEDRTITAWDNITVGKNIITNGHKLTLIAGSSIDAKNPSINILRPDMELKIGNPATKCGGNPLPQTPSEIYTFCHDKNKYKNDAPKQKVVIKDSVSLKGHLKVAPNPFSNWVMIDFSVAEEGFVNVSLLNSLGQIVKEIWVGEKQIGDYQQPINTNDLSEGMYFIRMVTKNGQETKKLMKINR